MPFDEDLTLNVLAEHIEGTWADGYSVKVNGGEVSLYFWRGRELADDPADRAVSETVAHIVVSLKKFRHMPDALRFMADNLGLDEGPDNPDS